MFEKLYTDLLANDQLIRISIISADGSEVVQLATLQTIFKGFANYYRDHWLGIVTSARLLVYNLPHRTNDDEESYHRAWRTYVGIISAPIVFIGKFKELKGGLPLLTTRAG